MATLQGNSGKTRRICGLLSDAAGGERSVLDTTHLEPGPHVCVLSRRGWATGTHSTGPAEASHGPFCPRTVTCTVPMAAPLSCHGTSRETLLVPGGLSSGVHSLLGPRELGWQVQGWHHTACWATRRAGPASAGLAQYSFLGPGELGRQLQDWHLTALLSQPPDKKS